jgi:hypothetical protein
VSPIAGLAAADRLGQGLSSGGETAPANLAGPVVETPIPGAVVKQNQLASHGSRMTGGCDSIGTPTMPGWLVTA